MSALHTPTPWEAEPMVGRGAWIKGGGGEWAALSCGDADSTARANAAFIVKAVNAHDELVAALVMAREWMSSVEAPLCDTTAFKRDCATIDAALAKATP